MNLNTIHTVCVVAAVIFQILVILCGAGAKYCSGKINTMKEKKQTKQQHESKETARKTFEGVKKNKTLILSMMHIDKTSHDKLLKKYPLGYCLFGIDRREIVVPYKSRLLSDFKIDWNKAKVIKITSEAIMIKLPDILDIQRNNRINNCSSGNKREVGSINRAFRLGEIGIVTEVLADDEKGVICLIGFTKEESK
jgi:hypothetical protein